MWHRHCCSPNGLEGGLTIYVWFALAKVDALMLIAVAALSAALTLVGPHRDHPGHGGHDTRSPRCAVILPSGAAAIVLDPGRRGTNAFRVTGPARTVREVRVSLAHAFAGGAATQATLTQAGGAWTGSAVLPFTGDWQATPAVRVDAFTEEKANCPP